MSSELLLVYGSHLDHPLSLHVLLPLGLHVVKLLAQLCRIIRLYKLLIHLLDPGTQLRVLLDLRQRFLELIVIIVFLLVLSHEKCDAPDIGFSLNRGPQTFQLVDRSLDRPSQLLYMVVFLSKRSR